MKYYLATNETDIFHFGKMEEGAVLTTGQSKVFYFNTEQELINKLTQLTGDSNYYQNNLESEFNPIQPPSNPEF
jgi:hypothetical protein